MLFKFQDLKTVHWALLAAACLSDETIILEGIPNIADFRVIREMGEEVGLKIKREITGDISIDPRFISATDFNPKKSSSFRTAYYFVGRYWLSMEKCPLVILAAMILLVARLISI